MSMNIFRLAGDMSHLFSIIVLLLRLQGARNAQGISVRTHELFLLVFVTRYLDLFTFFYSYYNSVMKIFYIISTALIVYTIHFQEPIKSTYDKAQDTFRHWQFAVLPCAIIAGVTHWVMYGWLPDNLRLLQLLWTFSIYLESIAIVPQLIVLIRYREVENLTGNYIFFMGAYRVFYLLNWVYRAHTEPYYQHNWVAYFCGVLQTLLYADFFYYYFTSSREDDDDDDDSAIQSDRAISFRGNVKTALNDIFAPKQLESKVKRRCLLSGLGTPEIDSGWCDELELTEETITSQSGANLWHSVLSARGEDEAERAHLVQKNNDENTHGYPCDYAILSED